MDDSPGFSQDVARRKRKPLIRLASVAVCGGRVFPKSTQELTMMTRICLAAALLASLASSPATAQYAVWARDCALRPQAATSDYCLNAYRRCCYAPPPQPQQQVIRNGTVTIIIGR
jgi:hypothetical protein